MNFFKKLVILALGAGFLYPVSLPAQEYLDNALYVKFKESSSVSAKKFRRDMVPIESLNLKISEKKMKQNGFHREARSLNLFDDSFLDRTFQIHFDSTVNIDKVIRLLESDPGVELVERVPVFKLFSAGPAAQSVVPQDPYYPAYNGIEYLWYLKMINAEGAWALQKGIPSIKAAVVDGAVWGEHADLGIPSEFQYNAFRMREGNSSPEYDDQDGRCATLYDPDPNVDPCPPYTWSHGTHCAGVVGAKNDNNEGIASLASGVTLLGVAATTAQYAGFVIAGYEGIRWAAANGAKVISCSWGGETGGTDVGQAILKACYDKDITIVAAAGNSNVDYSGDPASSMYVLTVGSVDENKAKSYFSNYGNWVDILAPGGKSNTDNKSVGIFSTTYCKNQSLRLNKQIDDFNDAYYDEMQGTSMATPLVASLCALMLSADSTLTPAQIKDILQNTSHPATGYHFTPLAGIINAEAAIKAVKEARYDAPVENLAIEKIDFDTVWLKWNEPANHTHEILGYRIFRNGEIIDSCTPQPRFADYPAPNGKNYYMVSVVYKDGVFSPRMEIRAVTPDLFTITTVTAPLAGGTVTGAGKYGAGATCTLNAVPNEGYTFVRWRRKGTSGTISTNPEYSFRVTEDQTYTAVFEQGTANEQAGGQDFSIAPNPAKDHVRITCTAGIRQISICDLQGRIIMKIDVSDVNEHTIDTENLDNGTYIIRLQTANGNLQRKFVKI